MYKCFNCQRELDMKDVEKRVICTYCGSRIIVKKRLNQSKKVKAR
ncbi:MAG: DNA-directed RNA polymerase subunit P [DPANN group archaeon]|nr:DNA-directed RNA polymerase subunit P [DPANN group archaeon]